MRPCMYNIAAILRLEAIFLFDISMYSCMHVCR